MIAGRIIIADTGTAPLNPGHPLSQTWIDTNLNLGSYNLYTLGNVGIGTASPGQKLTVAGAIESTSGGFKFPDGSVQASAVSDILGSVTHTSGQCIVAGGEVLSIVQLPGYPAVQPHPLPQVAIKVVEYDLY